MGNASNISLGAGTLYVAALGSTEPTDVTTALAAAWKEIGYTEEGSEISIEVSSDPVEVAEEIDPVLHVMAGRTVSISFAMAENTARNLTLALNGGTVSTGAGVTSYEPPAPSAAQRVMLGIRVRGQPGALDLPSVLPGRHGVRGAPQGCRQGDHPGGDARGEARR